VLNTAQIRALETQDFATMTTAQLHAFSSLQTSVLSTTQIEGLNSSQISAFTTSAYQQLIPSTPIILDLDGDGVRTLGISSGVKFDIFGDGQPVNTGWVSSGDGLLVLDRNHDGSINDGSELFGSSTKLADAARASEGYAALRELDTNGNGAIDKSDALFAELRVWIDSNSDGVSGAGELRTLESLGIISISLSAEIGTKLDNGNVLGLTSTYKTADGSTRAAADVWFAADKSGKNASDGTLDAAIAALNSTIASSTTEVAEVSALAPSSLAIAPKSAEDNLRTRVNSLAQVIGSFGEMVRPLDKRSFTLPDGQGNLNSQHPSETMIAGSMAQVMKGFDSNGKLLNTPLAIGTSNGVLLGHPVPPETTSQGLLVIKAN
jgi:hypothetical protein